MDIVIETIKTSFVQMTKISSYTTTLEWGMDKCPRSNPLLLSFKSVCARCICFSARSPLHTSSDALAKYKDGSPWSAVEWLKLETVSLPPYVTWSGSLRPLTGEHISSASLGLQTNQGMAMVCTCNVGSSCSPSSNVFASLQNRLQSFRFAPGRRSMSKKTSSLPPRCIQNC